MHETPQRALLSPEFIRMKKQIVKNTCASCMCLFPLAFKKRKYAATATIITFRVSKQTRYPLANKSNTTKIVSEQMFSFSEFSWCIKTHSFPCSHVVYMIYDYFAFIKNAGIYNCIYNIFICINSSHANRHASINDKLQYNAEERQYHTVCTHVKELSICALNNVTIALYKNGIHH